MSTACRYGSENLSLAPPRFRATGYGVMNFVGIASGAYVTPLLGKLKDSGVPLATGFAYCALPALLAAVLMFLLRSKAGCWEAAEGRAEPPKERPAGKDPGAPASGAAS